jgi:NAD-dependent SIR2 family protein deacetylase
MTPLEELARLMADHPRVMVLTGAGISTASGIPGYRDAAGVRHGRAPIQGPEFRKSEAVRRRYWARSMVGWPMMRSVAPNPGHLALAAMERAGHVDHVLTQNVDGLHREAGSQNLLELHGNVHRVVCLDCGAVCRRADLQPQLELRNPALANAIALPAPDGDAHIEPDALEDFVLPTCAACDGVLKPDVVFFGDNVPAERTQAAMRSLDQADMLLVVGTSLMVFSGYRFARKAAEQGKPVAAVNVGTTRADDLLALKVWQATETALPDLAGLLKAAS